MENLEIRQMRLLELPTIYRHIRRDFALGEYPPRMILYRQLKRGIMEGLILTAEGEDKAYAICAASSENGYVLLSLLAVFTPYRGQQYGTTFLQAIQARYADKKGIIVEVERPSDNDAERELRKRRIVFYERAGFRLVEGLRYRIWGIPMHLMVWQPDGEPTAAERAATLIREIYFTLLGPHWIHKLEAEPE